MADTRLHHPMEPELPSADDLSGGAARALMRTMKLQRQLMSKLLTEACEVDFPPAQAMCLEMVAQNDGITQRDLAEIMQLSRPTVTNLLQRMEAGGLVERLADTEDQRLTRVHVTELGEMLEEAVRMAFAEYVRQMFGTLSASDRRELVRLLDALCDNAARAIRDLAPDEAVDR